MNILIASCLLLASTATFAQGPLLPRDETPYEDWYNVELIVFAQNPASHGAPPPGVVEPVTGNAIELRPFFARQQLVNTATTGTPQPPESGFLPLPDNARRLTDVYTQLQRASGVRPIVHTGWRQHATAFADAPAVRIQGGAVLARQLPNILTASSVGNNPDATALPRPVKITEIDGIAKLSLGNDPQLLMDLVFRTEEEFALTRGFNSGYRANGDEGFTTWHLREHRAMDPGELHYFDHRRFGVIALVIPYRPFAAQTQPATAGATP